MGKYIGSYIKELREKKGLSQADVARLLSLKTAQSISNIERGVSPLPRAKIKRLADILGVKKGEIVTMVMREVQDRVSKAAGVQGKSVVIGELANDEAVLVNALVDRLRDAKTSERVQLKKAVRKLIEH